MAVAMGDFEVVFAVGSEVGVCFWSTFDGSGFSSTWALWHEVFGKELVEPVANSLLGLCSGCPEAGFGECVEATQCAGKADPL